jgi:hypothetical protein
MADAVSLLWYGAAATGVVEAVRKALVNRGVGYALSRHFLTAGIACMALSLAFGDPMTLDWADHLTSLRNAGIVVHNVLAMLAMVCAAGFLHTLGRLRLPMPGVVTIFAVCAAAMVTVYVLTGAHTPFFGSPRNPTLPSQLYSAIYLAYMVGWLVLLLVGLMAVAHGEPAAVRGGVALAQLGIAVALAGLCSRFGVVFRLLLDPHHPPLGTHFAVFTDAAGLALFVAGSLFAAATRRLFDWLDRRRSKTREAAIEHLWTRVRVLLACRQRPPLTQAQQLVEIEDALLIADQLIEGETRRAIRRGIRNRALLGSLVEPRATAAEIEIAISVLVTRLSQPAAEHAPDKKREVAGTEAWWPETERVQLDDTARTTWLAAVGQALTSRRVQRLAAKVSATRGRLGEE